MTKYRNTLLHSFCLGILLAGFSAITNAQMYVPVLTDFQKAQKAFSAGEHKKANYYYASILLSEPENVEARYGLARSYYYLQNIERALSELDKVFKINPYHEKSMMLRANINLKQQNWDWLLEDAEALIQLNPLNEQAYRFMDAAYTALGDEVAAKAALKRYKKIKTTAKKSLGK